MIGIDAFFGPLSFFIASSRLVEVFFYLLPDFVGGSFKILLFALLEMFFFGFSLLRFQNMFAY